jgi:hypothetical protein
MMRAQKEQLTSTLPHSKLGVSVPKSANKVQVLSGAECISVP